MNEPAKPYPIPPNEDIRLNILRSHHILDTEPEAAFDQLTKVAAYVAGVEISLISLVDRDRQFFKSCFGLPIRETPREQSFCAHAIVNSEKPLLIKDAREDSRTRNNPLVLGPPHIRSYGGFPIRDKATNQPLGTLCVIGKKPGDLSPEQIENLEGLARIVEDELELRAQKREVERSEKNYLELYEKSTGEIEHLRNEILSTINHELRTPLNGVIGLTSILKEEWDALPRNEVVELLEHVNQGGLALTELVRRITLYSELKLRDFYNQKKREGSAENPSTTIDDAFAQAVEFLEQNRHGGIRLSDLHVELDSGKVAMPEKYVKALLEELLDNASKFSSPGSPIRIEGRSRPGEYVFSLVDEGTGMSEEMLDRIGALRQFDRRSMEQQGIGLGLAIVAEICKSFDVELRLEGAVEEGTRVSLRFPVESTE